MTVEQLKEVGIPFNKWITLENSCYHILFSNEASIYPSPLTVQYYFDSSDGLLFSRNTSDKKFSSTLDNEPIEILYKENKKVVYPFKGGFIDSKIGRYHNVYDLDEITAIV